MNKPAKLKATFLLTLIISMSLLLILNSTGAMAQTNQAEVFIVNSVGGTTDPPASTTAYLYNDVDIINITAIPSDGFAFKYWVIQVLYTAATNQPPVAIPDPTVEEPWPNVPSSTQLAQDTAILTQNPLHIICGYGYTILYQPIFAPTTTTLPGAGLTNAIVNIYTSTGGTTSPAAGTYTYANGSAINLKATANDGFEFKYWIITASYIVGGNQPQIVIPGPDEAPWPQLPSPSSVASVNVVDAHAELQILCGYGYSVQYQAVFAPTGSGVTPPGEEPSGTDNTYLYAAIAVVAIIAVIGFALAYMYMKKGKTPK